MQKCVLFFFLKINSSITELWRSVMQPQWVSCDRLCQFQEFINKLLLSKISNCCSVNCVVNFLFATAMSQILPEHTCFSVTLKCIFKYLSVFRVFKKTFNNCQNCFEVLMQSDTWLYSDTYWPLLSLSYLDDVPCNMNFTLIICE